MTKHSAPLFALVILIQGISSLPAQDAGKVIDLKKPVGASIKPDVVYWSFDDGIVGESDPLSVTDLSGNSFDAQLAKADVHPIPTYAEGVFGTAIYVQGFPQVTWWKGNKFDAAPDPSKLIMKNRAFSGGVWFKMDNLKPVAHVLFRSDDNGVGWKFTVFKDQEADKDADGTSWYLSLIIGDSRDRARSLAATSAFADKKWHHVGFSITPGPEEGEFTAVYWMDGELFDTVTFKATVPAENPERRFFAVGNGAWGVLDDAFVTSGIHTFKK